MAYMFLIKWRHINHAVYDFQLEFSNFSNFTIIRKCLENNFAICWWALVTWKTMLKSI